MWSADLCLPKSDIDFRRGQVKENCLRGVVYSNQYATLLRGSPRFSYGTVSLVKRTWRHRLACSLSP